MVRLSSLIYAVMGVVSIVMGTLLYKDVVRGRDYIIREETSRIQEKSRLISQLITTKIVSQQFVLRDIHDRLDGDDLAYPDPPAAHYQDVSALLQAKVKTLPSHLLEGLVVFNSRCIYTANVGVDVLGKASRHPICKMDKVDPHRFYIHYLPAERSLINRPVLLIAYPFVDKVGKLEGGVIAVMNLTSAQNEIRQIETKHTDIMVIMDDQNNVLVSKPAFFGGVSSSIIYPSTLLAPKETDSTITMARAIKAGNNLYAVQAVTGTPLYVVVGLDIDDALQEWNRRGWQIAIALIIIILLCFFLARSFLNLRQQRDEMARLASIDPLTGVANRRRFMQLLADAHHQALTTGGSLGLLIIDIDYFKRINDTWGHPTGDRVIKAIAQILSRKVRGVGHVGRLGGEEFGVILPNKGEIFAAHLAEELRQLVAQDVSVFNDLGDRVRFQASIGIGMVTSSSSTKEDLLSHADKALYEAKRKGRNQVAMASPVLQPVPVRGLKSWRTEIVAVKDKADNELVKKTGS